MLRVKEQFLETVIQAIDFEDAFELATSRILEQGSNSDWFYDKYEGYLSETWQSMPSDICECKPINAIEERKDKAFAIIEDELNKAKPQIIDLLKEAVKNAIRRDVGLEPLPEDKESNEMKGILEILIAAVCKGISAGETESDKDLKDLEELYKDMAEDEEGEYLVEAYEEVLMDVYKFWGSLWEMFGAPIPRGEGNIADAMCELEFFVKDKAGDVKSALHYLELAQTHLEVAIISEMSSTEGEPLQRLFESDELATLVEVRDKLSSMLKKVFVS